MDDESELHRQVVLFLNELGFKVMDLYQNDSDSLAREFEPATLEASELKKGTVHSFLASVQEHKPSPRFLAAITRRFQILLDKRAFEYKKEFGGFEELNASLSKVVFVIPGNPPVVDADKLSQL